MSTLHKSSTRHLLPTEMSAKEPGLSLPSSALDLVRVQLLVLVRALVHLLPLRLAVAQRPALALARALVRL